MFLAELEEANSDGVGHSPAEIDQPLMVHSPDAAGEVEDPGLGELPEQPISRPGTAELSGAPRALALSYDAKRWRPSTANDISSCPSPWRHHWAPADSGGSDARARVAPTACTVERLSLPSTQ